MQTFLTSLGAMALYGVVHSLMAAFGFKNRARRVMGERLFLGAYTLLYNVLALLLLLPVVGVVAANPGQVVWSVGFPLGLGFLAIQVAGGLGLLISLLQIDGMRFLGLRQILVYLQGGELPLPAEPLQMDGVYRLVRHPLYLFSMMFLWATPVMTTGSLGLVVGISLYFVLGSLLEERKLHHIFGASYEAYQRQVPWLIPFVKGISRR